MFGWFALTLRVAWIALRLTCWIVRLGGRWFGPIGWPLRIGCWLTRRLA